MPESGLYPVQTWLWSELDDLGIDGVIYSRHILDLLISSKHTFDFRLEEKEQNIFSKIAPGANKNKHKYSRRSSSFSACEEILWKKEAAVDCLLSAAETKSNSEDTAATIQQVVDELYSKLAGLHLTADGKSTKSDGDISVTDYNGNNTVTPECERPRKRENYEDAFPSLDGASGSPVSSNLSDTVWNNAEKRTELKSGRDSDNSLKSKPPHPGGKDPKQSRFRSNSNKKGHSSTYTGSRSEGEYTPDLTKRTHTYPLYPRTSNRRYFSCRKPRAASTGCTHSTARYVGSQRLRKPPRPKQLENGRPQTKVARNDRNKKKVEKLSAQKRKLGDSKDAFKKVESVEEAHTKSIKKSERKTTTENLQNTEYQLDYAHLPSWMETTFADFSNTYTWSGYETYDFSNPNPEDSTEDEDPKEMPFSNRWYREPDSGLLTFQPLNSSKERSASSTSTCSTSSAFAGEEEDPEDEISKDNMDPATPAAPESWMWCPSPSLWEDGQTSPVSRLQSVYKRELMSLGAEDHVNDISGRIWEEYKTIFLDLQEMETGIDQDNISTDDDTPSTPHVWSTKDDFQVINPSMVSPPEAEKVNGGMFGGNEIERNFELWSHPAFSAFMNVGGVSGQQPVVSQDTGFQTVAMARVREPPMPKSSSVESNIWKYSQTWSTEDGIDQPRESSEICPDEELALLMQNGAFGYLCPSRKGVWDILPQGGQHHTVWGGGDMPSMEKPDTPQESHDERMMHTVVDALFSDMSFQLLFDPNDDPPPYSAMASGYQKMSLDPDYQTLNFGFRSLFVQTPIENFHHPDNNPWQPKWDMDDLFTEGRFSQFSPLAKLDDLFMSLASAEELDRQYSRFGKTSERKSKFLDSVTENEAWKTSLRIGNIWQAISGIRPVNVIYSENKLDPRPEEMLIPSSATHFRPISTSIGGEVNDTPSYDTTMNMDTQLMANEPPEFDDTGQDLNQIVVPVMDETKIGAAIHPVVTEEPSFHVNFSKLVHDKSMQTAFEMASQQDISSCQQFLTRPPKANSR